MRMRQAIIALLRERRAEEPPHGATVAEMAGMFGVSCRQIRYDLGRLSTDPDYEPLVLDVTYEWRLM